MKRLYICDYPYVLYSALIKMAPENEKSDLFILNSFDEMKRMYDSIQKTKIASRVFFSEDMLYRTQINKALMYTLAHKNSKQIKTKIHSLWKGFSVVWHASRNINRFHLPLDLNLLAYDEIYYSDRMSTMMFYLNKNNIPYYAMEHARNIWKTKPKIEILKFRIFQIGERLHLCCGVDCFTKACKGVIVTDRACAEANVPRGKEIVEWKIDDAIQNLSTEQRNLIYSIYADAFHLQINPEKTYNLLLTNPLAEDSFLPSQEQQVQFYQDVVRKYLENGAKLLIKPHPRDHLNYIKCFPDAIIVDKGIAAEILNLGDMLKLKNVLTLYSSSAESFARKADEVIRLEKVDTKPEEMKSLEAYRNV